MKPRKTGGPSLSHSDANEEIAKLRREIVNLKKNLTRLSEIGCALSAEHNLDALLEKIVTEARRITRADGGTLYILEKNALHFKIVQNDSLKIRMGGATGVEITFPPVALKRSNVSAYVALTGKTVNIPDVYNHKPFDFTGPKKFDEQTGYRTKSMLVAPMKNLENEVIGVLQLINARKPKSRQVISFSSGYVNFINSMASQATAAITNASLMEKSRRITARLQESEARTRAIMDYAPDGIVVIDEEGNILSFNAAAEKIFGYAAKEVIGKSLKILMPEPHFSKPDTYLKNYLKTRSAAVLNSAREVTGRRKDGAEFPMALKVSEIRFGESRLFSGIVRDITAEHEAERKILEANSQLALARDHALEASRAKSRFMANMSHELRTPMNAIIGYSEMLTEEAAERNVKEFIPDLKNICIAAKQLLALINDILDLSKIEAGKMEIHLESLNISSLIQEVAGTLQPLIRKNHNTLEINCPPDIGDMVADTMRVRQMLLNLMSNSGKFTENGVIKLNVKRFKKEGSDVDWISFEIVDSGIGMTAEQIGKLFDEFAQANIAIQGKYGGTGLGLSISRRFCRMMGGDIFVKSKPGKGSVFTIHLPGKVMPLHVFPRRRASDPMTL
ncbi:MAG: PAS domain S-box protein [Nitrospinales bacterium]